MEYHLFSFAFTPRSFHQHKEAVRRESILLEEYSTAIKYLNQFLPEEKRMKYVAFDMGRAAKRYYHSGVSMIVIVYHAA